MDLSGLGSRRNGSKPIHPREIFSKLPSLPGTPNDLWTGQGEALDRWHEARERDDALIALNMGAGKTLVGLLIAQSLVNEGLQNVFYVCATRDLVEQTRREAEKVGIRCTTRVDQTFSDDLFEAGQQFCLTTYHAIFNGFSVIRRRHFPEALIFDDAHVAEKMLRDNYTLTIMQGRDKGLYADLTQLFGYNFQDVDRLASFKDVCEGKAQTILMATPGATYARAARLEELFRKHGVTDHEDLKYTYANVRDRLGRCAILFGRGRVEITPFFLPTLGIDVFERRLRRIYLSASLDFKTDVIRGFGRQPDVVVEPESDAGNGERLILSLGSLPGAEQTEALKKIASGNKVVIAVPTYSAADAWAWLAKPPKAEKFTHALNEFRKADSGAFILVFRVDGIDLPDEACRIMTIDGLPAGGSLLERYQWEYLNMRNFFAARLANRIVQLFGRINRGRKDYGVYLIRTSELAAWLKNPRNRALLPPLLQQQLALGDFVQEAVGIKTADSLQEITNKVLGRAADWIKLYGENIDKSELDMQAKERADLIEDTLIRAAESEAKAGALIWEGEYGRAREALESGVEDLSRADEVSAGWHNVQIAGCYEAEGDGASALANYQRARGRLGVNFVYPRSLAPVGLEQVNIGRLSTILDLINVESPQSYNKQFERWKNSLANLDSGSYAQVEESLRSLGELLGFESSRPDNQYQTGPDVLWRCPGERLALPIEVKSDKKEPCVYYKKEVSQLADSSVWG